MTPEIFQDLLERLGPHIESKKLWYRTDYIPAGMKLAITLRFMATGDSTRSLMYLFRVAYSTVSLIIRRVTGVIFRVMYPEFLVNPDTEDGWREVAEVFRTKWNFQHCIGALDGKHVRIKVPKNAGSTYWNYKGYNSVVLLALVDAQYRFLWVDVGAPGGSSDAQLWNASDLQASIQARELSIPEPEPLVADDRDIPYFIIGDNAFALRDYLMKPYANRDLTDEERIFNYRLSRARRVVENAFGIMANRFQCLLSSLRQKPETVEDIVLACCVMHNYLRTVMPGEVNAAGLLDEEDEQQNVVRPGKYIFFPTM